MQTCPTRVGLFTEPSRLLEDIPFMEINVDEVFEEVSHRHGPPSIAFFALIKFVLPFQPRVSFAYSKTNAEGWIAEFIRSMILRYLASSIVEEPWLFVDFYCAFAPLDIGTDNVADVEVTALAPLVPDTVDPVCTDRAQQALVVIDGGVDEATIIRHLLRLLIFAWFVQSGDLGERRWIWVSDPVNMKMVLRR